MKRLILASSLAVICIISCIASERYVIKHTAELSKVITLCAQAACNEDAVNAQLCADKAMRLWNKREPVFNILLIYDTIQTLCVSIPQLSELAKNGDYEQLYYISLECKYSLETLARSQGLKSTNILVCYCIYYQNSV